MTWLVKVWFQFRPSPPESSCWECPSSACVQGHVLYDNRVLEGVICHVKYYTGMHPCTLHFLPPVKRDFAWGDHRSSLLKYSTRYYVPCWSNSACQMGSDRIGPRQSACRKTLVVRPHVEQITVEKVLSLWRCCPCTLTRGHLSDSARQGYFTRQKSIVHLISKSADMLCVLHYL